MTMLLQRGQPCHHHATAALQCRPACHTQVGCGTKSCKQQVLTTACHRCSDWPCTSPPSWACHPSKGTCSSEARLCSISAQSTGIICRLDHLTHDVCSFATVRRTSARGGDCMQIDGLVGSILRLRMCNTADTLASLGAAGCVPRDGSVEVQGAIVILQVL